jgi:hypothetical protein
VDSTVAFQQAMRVLLSRNASGAGGGWNLSIGTAACGDMGGASLNLGGGDFLISAPIVIPCHVCNVRVHGGTLRATKGFPRDKYLIETAVGCASNNGAGAPEFLGFSELLLDCGGFAAGGLHLPNNMGTNVGPRIFVTGFSQHGISIEVGHEVMVHETWVCPEMMSGRQHGGATPRHHFNGTSASNDTSGILVWGADHYLTNVIVFSTGAKSGSEAVGVEVAGGGNLLTGVHTWQGGIGIFVCWGEEWPRTGAVGQAHNRIVDSYLDMNLLVACDPTMLTIIDSYFLAGGHIVLRATPYMHEIKGLSIHDSTFRPAAGRAGPTIVLDQSKANFTRVLDMTVSGSVVGIDGPSWDPNTTVDTVSATRELRKTHATEWRFDFGDVLLFAAIKHVTYSITIEGESFARHAARPPIGNVVTVATDEPVTATVSVTVDQSDHSSQYWQNQSCPCPWGKDCKCR